MGGGRERGWTQASIAAMIIFLLVINGILLCIVANSPVASRFHFRPIYANWQWQELAT